MNPRTAEAAGILCHWSILAVVVAAAASMGVLAALGARPAEAPAKLLLPDQLVPPGHPHLVAGYWQRPPADVGWSVLIGTAGGTIRRVWSDRKGFMGRIEPPVLHRSTVTVLGSPYSSLSFRRTSAAVRALSPTERLVLVDASLLRGKSRRRIRQILSAARRAHGGLVAVFHRGDPSEWGELVWRRREKLGDALLLAGHRGRRNETVVVRRLLKRFDGGLAGRWTAITADEDLAREMSRLGAATAPPTALEEAKSFGVHPDDP